MTPVQNGHGVRLRIFENAGDGRGQLYVYLGRRRGKGGAGCGAAGRGVVAGDREGGGGLLDGGEVGG